MLMQAVLTLLFLCKFSMLMRNIQYLVMMIFNTLTSYMSS